MNFSKFHLCCVHTLLFGNCCSNVRPVHLSASALMHVHIYIYIYIYVCTQNLFTANIYLNSRYSYLFLALETCWSVICTICSSNSRTHLHIHVCVYLCMCVYSCLLVRLHIFGIFIGLSLTRTLPRLFAAFNIPFRFRISIFIYFACFSSVNFWSDFIPFWHEFIYFFFVLCFCFA